MNRIVVVAALGLGLSVAVVPGAVTRSYAAEAAATPAYKEGEKIDYRSSRFTDKWEIVTFLRLTPSGKQAVIRQAPNEFYKDGAERAVDLEDLRPLTAKRLAEEKAEEDRIKAIPYKPGDKIEYQVAGGKYEIGTFVRLLPGSKQAIIREKPNEFNPDGSQRAADLTTIRLPGSKTPPPPAGAGGGTNGTPAPRPNPAPPETPRRTTPERAVGAPAAGNGQGVLSAGEVLAYLQKNLGDQPFQVPNRAEILKQLVVEIKRRGVGFHLDPLSDTYAKLSKFGLASDVMFPIKDNFGPPTKQAWYLGVWDLDKIGATVDFERDGKLYRQLEIGARGGFLDIRGNGTYVWKEYPTDPPAKYRSGKWRAATAEEMSYQGGEGIVLLNAKTEYDWILMQDRVTTLKGDWFTASEIRSRQIREFGFRRK